MNGAPWKWDDKPAHNPIFKKQAAMNSNAWVFVADAWSKNTCNEYALDILYPGPVKVDDWEYETACASGILWDIQRLCTSI